MIRAMQTFIHDEHGEGIIEYGLLASFVAAVAVATIVLDPIGLRTSLVAVYRKVVSALSQQ